MTKQILVLGGYGNFGKRICTALAKSGVPLVVAGRDAGKAQALALQLQVAWRCFDVNTQLAQALQTLQPAVVINTCGPFQGSSYAAAQTCIDHGVHYIDLADGRDFVGGITQLNTAAQNAGVSVISGASTVPGLSSAVLEHFKAQFSQMHELVFGISPGQQAERGLATTQGIMSYVGKPLKAFAGHTNKPAYGWQDLYRQNYPELGWRWMANCDIPDLDLLPARYGLRSIRFSAGLEIGLLHLGLWSVSGLVRAGLPIRLQRWAGPLLSASNWFNRFGSPHGGMHVIVRGMGLDKKPLEKRWFIVAKNGDGPQIPCVPAIVLARKLARGDRLPVGAYPCVAQISLDEYLQELQAFDIRVFSDSSTSLPAPPHACLRGL